MGTKIVFEDSSGDMFFIEEDLGHLTMREIADEMPLVMAEDLDAFIDWLCQERNKWVRKTENDQV